ncbi:MAG: hypothetical protein Q8Q12_18765 [bacterium]|nr:hypothetical protein [bacterium]
MFSSSKLSAVARTVCALLAGASLVALVSVRSYAQEEERWKVFTTPPENVQVVWFLQARHVASELDLDREASRNLTRAYTAAREEHLKKLEALPKEPDSMGKFMEIRDEAASALEKSLVEALGEEKGKKASALLGGFSLLFDHLVADILTAQTKALTALFKYEEVGIKAMKEARESGSWEGMREKLRPAVVELGKQASSIYSQQQLNEWKEKYGWFFDRILSE